MNNQHLNALGRITLLITFNLSLLACGGGNETPAVTTPANTAPVATDASVSLLPGSTVTGALAVNDIDGDNQTISIVTDANNGTLTLDNATTGAYTYAHGGNVNGDSFTFMGFDGLLDSNIATVTIITSAPAAPSNGLTAINGDRRITLNWDPVPGADSYIVYFSDLAGTGTAGNPFHVTKPPFYSDDVSNGTTYYYVVEAVNVVGGSDASVEVSATPNLTRLDSLTFTDANLDACIDALAGFTYVSQLTTLDCSSKSISQLDGIEALSSLSLLKLNNNTISEIVPLVGLKSLATLNLLGNKNISDVSSLSELTKLENLSLGDNTISDVSSLAGLQNLKTLGLEQNIISDVSALAGMVELTRLTLHNNSLININALAGMTKMDVLNLSFNSIVDVSQLAGMTVMTYLDTMNNSIEDVSQLSTLTGLKTLVIRSNSITDVSALASLVNLTYLDLRVNTLGTGATGGGVDTLSTLTSATSILLSNNFGIACGELQTLIDNLPGVVDITATVPNCTAI